MIIHITDELTYDTAKSFDEQEQETIDFLDDIIANRIPDKIDIDSFHRETCRYWNICTEATLKYIFIYEREESAWNVSEMKVEMEVRNE